MEFDKMSPEQMETFFRLMNEIAPIQNKCDNSMFVTGLVLFMGLALVLSIYALVK